MRRYGVPTRGEYEGAVILANANLVVLNFFWQVLLLKEEPMVTVAEDDFMTSEKMIGLGSVDYDRTTRRRLYK